MANNLALPNDWVVESTPQNDFEKNNINGLPEGFEVERISGENSKAPSPIENVINTLKWVNNTRKSAYQEGKDMVRTADLETKDATVGLNYVEQAELDNLTNSGKTYEDYGVQTKENYKNEKWTLKGLAERAPHFAKTSYIEALKMLPIMVETTKSTVATGAIGAGGGAVAGLAGGPFSELTVPAGAGMGWLWGARIGAAARIAEIEGGLARNELRSVNKEIEMEGGKPLSTLEINALASSVGVANAGLELVGLNAILKTVPAGKLLLEKMGQKSVRDLAKDKVLRSKLAEVTKDYALSVATEPTTEMVQEISNIIAEEYARKLGGVENTPMEQNIARVIETGKAAFGATLFLGGFGSVAKVSTIMVQNGMEKAQAEKVAESMTLDERAEFIAENADTLISTAPNQAQEIENKISENEKEDIENDFFRKAVNSGVDESQAFALSRMLGTFAQKFAPSAEKIKEWSDKIQVRYNVPSENILYGEISNDTENAEKKAVRIAEIEKEIQDIAANENDIDFKRLDELEEEYNNLKREESENEETQIYNVDKNLKENFDMSSDELVDMVKADIDNILQEADVTPEEFNFEDIRVYGSYTKGKNKETSDLDFIVQYSGTMREDDAFNMLHDEDLTIQDKNGRTVTIDINPINRELSGTIDEHIGQRYFQSVETAGADGSAENSAAKKEWRKKGTDSKYFKKWFGDSKVKHSTTDKPIIVYHSSDFKFNTFKPKGTIDFAEAIYFSSSKAVSKTYGNNTYACYLKIENPYIVDAQGQSYNNLYDRLSGDVNYAVNNGYDGVIVRNIRDDWGQHKNGGRKADTYIVFNPEQIKSVDNQGTFDSDNPNIYYQGANTNYREQLEDAKSNLEYKKFVNKVLTGKLSQKEKRQVFKIGRTPAKLVEAGLPDNDVSIGYKIIEKAQNNKNADHNLSKETISEVWNALKNPIAVIKAEQNENEKKENNRYSAILDLQDDNGKYVLVAIEADKYAGKFIVNDIRSIHSRKSYEPIIDKALNDKRLLKVDAEKIRNLLWGSSDIISEGDQASSKKDLPLTSSDIISEGAASLIERIAQQKNDVKYYQSVYHGTPHKFDEFSLDAIGTGEGAQAHGWGLYFAGKKNVSENYRRKLTQSVEDIIYNGEKLNTNSDEYNVIVSIDNFRDVNNDTFEKAQEAYIKQFKRTAQSENEAIRDYAEKRIKIAESIDAKKIKYDGKGQLFEVDIPENDVMLDEDKTLNEQPEKVKKAILEYYKSRPNDYIVPKDINSLSQQTGKNFYRDVAFQLEQENSLAYRMANGLNTNVDKNFNAEKEASLLLNSLGIKGIKYDGRQDGRCYVVFDDKAVQVLKKYYQRIEGESEENNGAFTPQSYDDLVERHNDKLFEQQQKYLGYFQTSGKQNLITIMENANASTLPHEMGHLFLSALNEFAIDDEEARIQLEEVDKHLGRIAGEDYTVEQHEKFARWFEAYLYTGKAPSYKLRDVFENFKEWLRSIKDYWVANYEMPKDVQKLFDNMFGEQKSFYDKEQETKIKNTLQKVKNLTLSQRLTDTQKRHREIAYDIVARATGKKKEYLKRILESESSKKGIQKQKSDIINLVAEAEDKIIGSDGFLPEWLEFFSDSELYQEGNDSKLAQAALDTILNKSYKTEISEYDFLNEADAQYKYMINQFKKGQNRDVIYSVFWEWLDGQDDFVKEIYSEQFEEDMTQIEHKEHSLEFEKIKQKILIEARKVTGKDDIEKYKKIVLTTMKGLKFLTPEDKSRMATAIFDCPSLSFLENRIDKILDMAETLNERDYRRRLFNKIDRLLEGTKNIKQGNKTVGKYDYASNKIFETLREINKLNGKQAEKYISDIKTLVDAETADDGSGISYETKLCNMLAQIRAGGMKRPYKNTPLLKQFVDELTKMKILARESKNEVEFLAKLDNQKDIEEVKNILNKKPNTMIEKNLIDSIDGKTPFLKTVGEVLKSQDKASLKAKQLYICTVANWESALNTVFGKTIRNKYSLLHAQAEAEVWKDSMKKKFMEGAAKIYNCKIQEFDNQILKNLSEKFDFTEAIYTKQADGKYKEEFVNKRMNKMEILLAWMWYKNDVLKERLEHQFGNEQLNEVMFSYLSKEDKELGDFMMGLINEIYTPANEMYIKKYGIELPKVSSYFPSTVERGSEIDLLSDYTMKSNAPSAIKTRSNATTIRMKFSNPVAIFYNHIDSMGDFIHMTDKVDKINKVFRNPVVVSLIKNKFGDVVFKELNQEILNFSYKKQANTANWIDKVTSGIVNNWISGTLSLKLNVGFKQLLSASNYAVDMPINVWVAGFADAITHPKETIDYMMKIPYLKTRFEGSAQNEALQQFVNSARLAKVKKFKEFLMLNVRCGDIGAIIFGGKPYIDYMIEKKGMTEQDAINAFVDQTNRTQQSSLTSSLSNFQMASRGRGLAQLFTAYRNTQNQYIRLVADEIIDYYDALNNGDLSSPELKNEARTKLAKVVFNYMFLQPLLYTLATSLSVNRWANSGGDDDDWKKDVLTSLFDMNAKAVALFGDLYNYIMNVAIKGEKGMVASMPILGEIETDINKLAKEDASIEDVLGLICVLTHASTGVDLKTPVNEVQGVWDILHGDFQRGIYRMMGYSKHRADYAILNE